MRIVLISVAILLAATPGAARERKPVPEATPLGEAVSCIPLNQIRATKVRSDRVIDFMMSGGRVFRNELPQDCPSLAFEERFLHRTTLNQYCSMDTITVLRSGGNIPGPTCGLGKFQPVKLVAAK